MATQIGKYHQMLFVIKAIDQQIVAADMQLAKPLHISG
jgi:hypothetical protein